MTDTADLVERLRAVGSALATDRPYAASAAIEASQALLSLQAEVARKDAALIETATAERDRVANELAALSSDTIRLHCGELSAQEMRTVKAFINWRVAAIRSHDAARKAIAEAT